MHSVQPAEGSVSRDLGDSKATETTCYSRANLPPTPAPSGSGQVVISRRISESVQQCQVIPANIHRECTRAFAGLNRKSQRRKRAARTDANIYEARTRLNRACRAHRLKFMYTLSTRQPIADLGAFDAVLHSFTEKLTEHGIRPWAVTRELTKEGSWHAHLGLPQLVDRKLLIRLWAAGFVKAPELDGHGMLICRDKQGRIHLVRPSWRAVARYLGKSFDELPARARFAFYSKLKGQTMKPTRIRAPGTQLEAFFAQVQGVHLKRLSRFHARDDRLSYELHDRAAPKGENQYAMAKLGRYALHVARQRRNAATHRPGLLLAL